MRQLAAIVCLCTDFGFVRWAIEKKVRDREGASHSVDPQGTTSFTRTQLVGSWARGDAHNQVGSLSNCGAGTRGVDRSLRRNRLKEVVWAGMRPPAPHGAASQNLV